MQALVEESMFVSNICKSCPYAPEDFTAYMHRQLPLDEVKMCVYCYQLLHEDELLLCAS
jgi:hypothetical protein